MKAKQIPFNELAARIYEDGTWIRLIEEACGVANAIHSGAGGLIEGTLMESDFRRALKLEKGQYVNFDSGSKANRGGVK